MAAVAAEPNGLFSSSSARSVALKGSASEISSPASGPMRFCCVRGQGGEPCEVQAPSTWRTSTIARVLLAAKHSATAHPPCSPAAAKRGEGCLKPERRLTGTVVAGVDCSD